MTKSSRPRVERADDGSLKVHVSSAPEKGKANAEVLRAISKYLGLRRSQLEIISGETTRDKVVRIIA